MPDPKASPVPPKRLWLVMVMLVVVQVGFGGYGIMVKKFAQNANVNQVFFSMLRDSFCFPLLFAAAYIFEGRIFVPTLRELPLFVSLGLLLLGNQLFYILGLYDSTANIASVWQPAIPIWTAIFVLVFRVEPLPNLRTFLGWLKVGGILTGSGGAALIILLKPSTDDTSKNAALGNVCLVVNTACMGLYVVLQKTFVFGSPHLARPPSRWAPYAVNVTAWAYLFGALGSACAVLYYVTDPSVFEPPQEIIPPLIYAVLVSSGLCYGLISWANKLISATLVTATWPLQVVVTVILSKVVFNDSLVAGQYIGAAMIACGLLAVTFSALRTDAAQGESARPLLRDVVNGSREDEE